MLAKETRGAWGARHLKLDKGSSASFFSGAHRRLAEEILLQAVRQVKATKELDTSLSGLNQAWNAKLKSAGHLLYLVVLHFIVDLKE